MYQLAIFDLDGTLLDTLADLRQGLNYALGTQGFAPRSMAEVRAFVGNGLRKLVERAVPAGTSEAQMDAVYEAFNPYYARHCADLTAPYDGILPLLQKLQAQGVVCALVSNKPDYAVQTLAAQYFPGLLAASAGAKDGVRKKPAPDSVFAVIHQLGAESTSATPRSTCRPRRTRRCPASRSAGASATGACWSRPERRASATRWTRFIRPSATDKNSPRHHACRGRFLFPVQSPADGLDRADADADPSGYQNRRQKLHDAPSFLVCSCSGSRGSCASTAQAALCASSAFRPSDCCIRPDSC